jgi:hypothetical protein
MASALTCIAASFSPDQAMSSATWCPTRAARAPPGVPGMSLLNPSFTLSAISASRESASRLESCQLGD